MFPEEEAGDGHAEEETAGVRFLSRLYTPPSSALLLYGTEVSL